RLVAEEVGAGKSDESARTAGAVFALCAVALIWGIRGLAHHRAKQMLDAHVYNGEDPARLGAFPTFSNPFIWNGVVETHASYFLLQVDTLAAGVRVEDAEALPKPQPSPALATARAARSARIFLNFARFPWATVDKTGEGYRVRIRDLRFASSGSGRARFVVQVDLDRNLHIRKQTFTFRVSRRSDPGIVLQNPRRVMTPAKHKKCGGGAQRTGNPASPAPSGTPRSVLLIPDTQYQIDRLAGQMD
ncbi:MAG: hypothetical protein ACRD22_06305, partial [Terriglobia bacterium]